MNDRIKNMATQFWEIKPGLQFNQMRFAAAIIQECLDLALGSSHREDDMGAIIANKIKKHFGVEE